MFRKNALKIFIISLCALFIAPVFSIKNSVVNADEPITPDNVVAPRGVEFVYDTEWEGVNAENVLVKAGKSDDFDFTTATTTVFDGSKKDVTEENNALKGAIISMSYSSGKITASFGKIGKYVLEISDKATENAKPTKQVKLEITNDVSNLNLSYKLGADDIKAYQDEVAKTVGTGESALKIGDTFTIPTFEDILNISNLAYTSLNKTVHYAASGATYYSTATSTFEITTVGTYKFYATFETDELIIGNADSKLSIDAKFLVEKDNGFYMAKKDGTDTQVFAQKHENDYKYYEDKEFETEYTGAVDTTVLVIPTFTFEIKGAKPTVKSDSTYQEKGYIGYEYTGVKFTVKGNDITTTYVLEYSEDGNTWAKAEEELSSSLAFTPTKKGYYKVTATVIDCEGNSNFAHTEKIEVNDKFVTVEFKTSFADWLSVNTVPFIFLCISAVALIGLIVVIAIPVKDKKEDVKAEEIDK